MVGEARVSKWIFTVLLFMMLAACGEVFDVHPYDVDFQGERNINAHHIAEITQALKDRDSICFVVTGDAGWYDNTIDMVADINRHKEVDFVIHGGDFSNYGATKEFVRQRDILGHLHVPYVGLLGNHDCLGTGPETFRLMYGEADFSFIAARVKFICLNTNAREYDFIDQIPNFDFLERQLTQDTTMYDRTVVCMHAPPYNEQFNNNVVMAFNHYVCMFPNVLFCTSAHLHTYSEKDLFGNGIIYYSSDSANHRSYLIFKITPQGYTHEVIHY